MSFRTKDGKFRRPKKIIPDPPVSEIITKRKFWAKRSLTYLKTKYYYDQEVRTGVCYFCKKEGRAQKSRTTYLHHVKYVHSDPLAWTIEVCSSCHYQIDPYNQKILDRRYGGKKTVYRRY